MNIKAFILCFHVCGGEGTVKDIFDRKLNTEESGRILNIPEIFNINILYTFCLQYVFTNCKLCSVRSLFLIFDKLCILNSINLDLSNAIQRFFCALVLS